MPSLLTVTVVAGLIVAIMVVVVPTGLRLALLSRFRLTGFFFAYIGLQPFYFDCRLKNVGIGSGSQVC